MAKHYSNDLRKRVAKAIALVVRKPLTPIRFVCSTAANRKLPQPDGAVIRTCELRV